MTRRNLVCRAAAILHRISTMIWMSQRRADTGSCRQCLRESQPFKFSTLLLRLRFQSGVKANQVGLLPQAQDEVSPPALPLSHHEVVRPVFKLMEKMRWQRAATLRPLPRCP